MAGNLNVLLYIYYGSNGICSEHRRAHSTGAAQRFLNVLRDASADRILEGVPEDMITSAEDARVRPEQLGLPPIPLMPSADPEVIAMQKEVWDFYKLFS